MEDYSLFDLAEILKKDESWESNPEIREMETESLVMTLLNS